MINVIIHAMAKQTEIEWEIGSSIYYLLKRLADGMYFNQFYLAEIVS